MMLIGAICGVVMVSYLDKSTAETPLYQEILSLVGLFLGMYVALFFHMIVHEAGHLVFGLLYGIAYTIKMSYKGDHKIDGHFEYVVPPLEDFWWQDGVEGIDYAHNFISLIRLPDFVTKADFDWAISEATKKKKTDFSKVEFLTYNEGLCVQSMHIGSYDDEPATIAMMHEYAEQNGYKPDITDTRYYHEIYLSDPRKCDPDKLKTVVRHPIKKVRA